MAKQSVRNNRMSRRQFLRDVAAASIMAVGGAFVASCQGKATPQSGGTAPTATPLPTATASGGAAATATPVPTETAAPTPTTMVTELPRNETLYVAGFQWGPPTTFNPLSGNPTWPSSDTQEHLYETLFAFNLLTGDLDPILGKELTFTDETTGVITMQPGTHWQDGQPLTSADVVYTFELAKRHNDLAYSTFWEYVSEMTAQDDQTIQFKLNPDQINPGMARQFISTTRILPQHIWEQREQSGQSLSQIVDNEPVGSGPYKVQAFSTERIALVRDDNYWGQAIYGTPAPKYVVHPIFKSNDDGNLALQRGEVDISQQFVPQIWKMWEDQNLPVGTWYKQEPYYVPGSIPLLFINVHKKGLDNPKVRRALACSIDYAQIALTAMSHYSVTVNSSMMLPEGGEKKFFDEANVKQYGWAYDPQKATEILEQELNAKKGSDGIYVLPDGTRLGPYTAETPYGWTDWMTALSLVAQNATAAGIDVTTQNPDAPVVTTHMQNGNFDLAIWYVDGAAPASPWLRFRDVLDDRGVPDFGQQAFWDYGRFKNADVPGLLDKAAAASDETTEKQLFGKLDTIFMENVPVIPLMYRPLEFYEYNESVWTGFPNADNPTAPPTQGYAGIEILYQIKAKSG